MKDQRYRVGVTLTLADSSRVRGPRRPERRRSAEPPANRATRRRRLGGCWPPSPLLEFGLGAGAAAAAPDSMVWTARRPRGSATGSWKTGGVERSAVSSGVTLTLADSSRVRGPRRPERRRSAEPPANRATRRRRLGGCWPPSPLLEFGLGAGAAAAAPDSMVWTARRPRGSATGSWKTGGVERSAVSSGVTLTLADSSRVRGPRRPERRRSAEPPANRATRRRRLGGCWPPSPLLEFGLGAGAAAAAPDSMVWTARRPRGSATGSWKTGGVERSAVSSGVTLTLADSSRVRGPRRPERRRSAEPPANRATRRRRLGGCWPPSPLPSNKRKQGDC